MICQQRRHVTYVVKYEFKEFNKNYRAIRISVLCTPSSSNILLEKGDYGGGGVDTQ